MCFKTSARMIVSKTKPMPKVNAKIAIGIRTPGKAPLELGTALESGTGSEVFRSW